VQDNHWVVQVVATCDLTPGVNDELEDTAGFIWRFEDDSFDANFNTTCMNGTRDEFAVVISNLPTGVLNTLDANYTFRLTNTGNKQK
jgi:hypothetical protein